MLAIGEEEADDIWGVSPSWSIGVGLSRSEFDVVVLDGCLSLGSAWWWWFGRSALGLDAWSHWRQLCV